MRWLLVIALSCGLVACRHDIDRKSAADVGGEDAPRDAALDAIVDGDASPSDGRADGDSSEGDARVDADGDGSADADGGVIDISVDMPTQFVWKDISPSKYSGYDLFDVTGRSATEIWMLAKVNNASALVIEHDGQKGFYDASSMPSATVKATHALAAAPEPYTFVGGHICEVAVTDSANKHYIFQIGGSPRRYTTGHAYANAPVTAIGVRFSPLEVIYGAQNGQILFDNGSVSQLTSLPTSFGFNGSVQDFFFSSSGWVFAVGENGSSGVRPSGSDWTAKSTGTTADLYSVDGTSHSDVWAVGREVILHYDGSQWTSQSKTGLILRAVKMVPGGAHIAVGKNGAGKMEVMRYKGSGTWQAENTGLTMPSGELWGVWVAPDDRIYAVGDGGTVLRYGPP